MEKKVVNLSIRYQIINDLFIFAINPGVHQTYRDREPPIVRLLNCRMIIRCGLDLTLDSDNFTKHGQPI